MKKLLLFFAVMAVTLISCDRVASYNFEINNDTQHEVIVKIGNQESVSIPSSEKKMIYYHASLGVTDPFKYIAMNKLKVIINDKIMSDDFWQREYWKERRESTYHFTYLMILTDELIENLLSQDNSQKTN